jgi:hypothetical protein
MATPSALIRTVQKIQNCLFGDVTMVHVRPDCTWEMGQWWRRWESICPTPQTSPKSRLQLIAGSGMKDQDTTKTSQNWCACCQAWHTFLPYTLNRPSQLCSILHLRCMMHVDNQSSTTLRTYIGRPRRRGPRHPPMFSIDMWNVHDRPSLMLPSPTTVVKAGITPFSLSVFL